MADIVRFFPGASSVLGAATGTSFPAGFVIPPGAYNWQGKVYDCTREGAYRFWSPGTDRTIRIVWSSDVEMLIRSLAWATAIGVADEGVALAQITQNARWSRPRLLCSKTASWVKYVCDSLGVPCRIVRALTAATPSGFFDGHVMVECIVGGVRRLFDPAAGWSFPGLSLRDAIPLAPGVLVALAPKRVSPDFNASSLFEPDSWYDCTLGSPADAESEWQRVLQIAGIDHPNGEIWWRMTPEVASRSEWVQSLSPIYRCKTPAEWDAAFYP